MMHVKKILAPTDFSAGAKAGLEYARDLSESLGAEVIVLHVSPHPSMMVVHGFGAIPIPQDLEEAIRSGVERGLEEAVQMFGKAGTVRSSHLHGNAGAEIIEFAKSESVDMIVMSTHGHTGIKHLLLGSVAERVVRTAPCPVVTVPSHPEA